MAVKLNTKSYGSSPKHERAMYGQGTHGAITPTYGYTTRWDQNLTSGGMSGDISNSWTINTNVGKTYEQICKIGTVSGFYPPGRLLKGFTFSHKQDSTASRAVWLKRYGAMSNDGKLWSSGTMTKKSDYNWHSKTATFDSSFLSHLNSSSRYIEYIMFQFSTDGGSVSRDTNCTIKDFKFTWIDGVSGKELILPKLRSYSERSDINAIA
jgi:hypothetical protein